MLSLGTVGFIVLGIFIIFSHVRSGEMGCGGIFFIILLLFILLASLAIGALTLMTGGM